ncbi:MAG: cytochrome c biogenesis protein ResB [Acidobacteriota bacterium]
MKKKKKILSKIISGISSSKFALYLVIALIILSIAGVLIPQQSEYTLKEIEKWSSANPLLSSIIRPLGFFHVFHSIFFLIVIVLFVINILSCTIVHFINEGGLRSLTGKAGIKKTGFFLLHIGLIGILAGGFISTGFSLDGKIVLTEGQVFLERHDQYLRIVEGPLRKEIHKEFSTRLKDVKITYEKKFFPVDIITVLDFIDKENRALDIPVQINKPYTFRGFSFTLDEMGFSPRIVIRDDSKKKYMLNSFIALKTFRHGVEWEYKDFLPLPFLKNRVTLTLYPDHKLLNGKVVKTSEVVSKPVIKFEIEDGSGKIISTGIIPFKGSSKVGDHIFTFADLRHWASFRVVEDPGYLLFGISVWLSILSLLFRYSGELFSLFKKG